MIQNRLQDVLLSLTISSWESSYIVTTPWPEFIIVNSIISTDQWEALNAEFPEALIQETISCAILVHWLICQLLLNSELRLHRYFFVTRQTRRYEIIQRDPSRLAVYGRLCCEILGVNFSCQMSQLTKFLFRILWWFPCQPRFLMLILTFATKLKRLTFLANYLSRWQRAAACWLQSIAISKRKEIREWILKVSNFIFPSAKEISESVQSQ